ncbi:MAG: SiaB family protein kinase [Bacteroidales bacterium]|nr:SiaB family protein kinase [Bacteroidales bacterium]
MHLERNHISKPTQSARSDPHIVLFAYEGPFFIDMLTLLGQHLKTLTLKNTSMQKKLFRVYIELAQNVAKYAEQYVQPGNKEKRVGIGEVWVKEDKNQYSLTTRNLVQQKDANILSQRCEIINNTDFHDLRDLKRELRKSSTDHKLGARIGLVQARLISDNPLHYTILEENRDYSYFKLTVKFSKNGEH